MSALPLPEGALAVGVVVPTRGRPRLLERYLDALAVQDLPPEEYDVVVVDDGPDTETAAVVAARPGVRYLCTPGGRGPATARNIGWRSLSVPVVAFTDDDCVPAPTWLRAGLIALEDGLDAAAGRTVVPLPDGRPTDFERNAALLDGTHFVTANVFCRRGLLEALGGFDERFRMAWREDADLELSALERGYALGTTSAAVVVHPLRRASWGVSLRQQKKTMFNALLRAKHPQLYDLRMQPSPRWYYAAAALPPFAAAAAVLGRRRLCRVALLTWAALTLVFAGRRLRTTSLRPAHVVEMLVTSAAIPPLSVFWRLAGRARFRGAA